MPVICILQLFFKLELGESRNQRQGEAVTVDEMNAQRTVLKRRIIHIELGILATARYDVEFLTVLST